MDDNMNYIFRAYKKTKLFFDWLCELVLDPEYKLYSPYYITYAAHESPDFNELYNKVTGYTLITKDRAYLLYKLAQSCARLDGEYAECGVWRGGSSYLIAEALRGKYKYLHCFDTFEGMPATARSDPSGHKPGEMGDTSLDAVKEYLNGFQFVADFIKFHPGIIPDTLRTVEDTQFAFVHIDLDLYQSVKDAVSFFYPRMTEHGIILFDDYGFLGYHDAARRAVDEFFEGKDESVISLPTGQAMIIKR